MDYSIYDYNSDEKLLQEQEIEEINNVKMSLLNTLVTKLNNAGIYFNSTSRIKSESSLLHKLETGKYSMQEGGRKIQDIIGIRINLFYLEDMDICEKILEETFLLDNWSKTKNEENKFEAQKCNGVFRIPSKYLRNIPASVWNKPFDQTFEVQLRTVLFEGWHEIEHEMRYKYKLGSDSKETDLWTGHEDLSRVMNSIIANLELCDWSIMQIFNSIHDSQYKEKNWENAIRSKYRLRITQDPLKPELRTWIYVRRYLRRRFFWTIGPRRRMRRTNLRHRNVTVCSGYRANICETYLQVCGTSHLTRHLRYSSGRCSSRVGMR